jgi:hypothetical protein
MKLEKFPVQGELGEYHVSVRDSYVCLGMYEWEVDIYKFDPNKMFFKYKRLHRYTSGWSRYREFIGKYVELAQKIVKDYESKIIQEQTDEINHEKGLKEFDVWDGKLQ